MTLKTLLLSKGERQITCQEQGTGEPFVLIHGVGIAISGLGTAVRGFGAKLPGHRA